MDKHWAKLFFGQVRIKIIGSRIERFLNRCLKEEVDIWNIRRTGENSVVCSVKLEDFKKVRTLLKQTGCKLRVIDRKGTPFLLRKLSTKSGFVSGMFIFVCILFLLSNLVWDVEVNGADPQVEHEIRQVLNDLDVKKGKFQFTLPPPEELQFQITQRLDSVTWIGAKLQGTTYTFSVVEKQLPREKEALTPRNLVSDTEAVVTDIYVEQGTPKVEPNDFVQKGDVLVSGNIGGEDGGKVVPAIGKVMGETWYVSEVNVPLDSTLKTYTGETYTKHAVTVFGFRIPIWGFSEPEFKKYDVETTETPLRFLKWTLPVAYEKTIYRQTEKVKREYTEKEAIKVAKQIGKTDLKEKLEKKAKIISENILRQSVENGKVMLKMRYTVIENISVPKNLIQQGE
jgi:similar to stage IV sporulation protein